MNDTELTRAATSIRGARQVALACHVNPDGDALGSLLGLFHVLRAAGTDVVASFPSPFVVARHYRELPGLELLIKPEDFPDEPDVMITFDCGSLDRLGDLAPAAKAAHELIVVDHHISNDRYGVHQPHRPRSRRERLGGATPHRHPPAAPQPGRGDGAVRRDRLRHRPLPVRHHDPRGLRPGPPAHRVRHPRREPVPIPLRGAPLRVPQAPQRGARRRGADPRAAVRVDRGHPGHAAPPRRHH